MDKQVAFFHETLKEIFTGTIVGKEAGKFKIEYIKGKDKLVAFITPKNVIPFEN